MNRLPRIAICICSYRRPELLQQALTALTTLRTDGLFDYSITVVDNDKTESARAVVESSAKTTKIPVNYAVEPEQNIALARNRAIANAPGDFIAFIDDDELPNADWLVCLYRAWQTHNADGILGPVVPHYDGTPPKWVVEGKFYDRPRPRSGTVLGWRSTRTGNVLLTSQVVHADDGPFRAEFGGGGEDRDFFRRMMERGYIFIWCDEAVVYEVVPAHRWSAVFMLRRALLRGQQSLVNPESRNRSVLTSFVALCMYVLALPFLLVRRYLFMTYLIKCCDHLGKCLAFVGVRPVRDKYITD